MPGSPVSEPNPREPKGAGADWTEERGTSDEGRRRLKRRPEASGKIERDEGRRRLKRRPEASGKAERDEGRRHL